jgi:integrase
MGDGENPVALEELAERLGLTLAPGRQGQPESMTPHWSSGPPGSHPRVPTFREVSERYLETAQGDEQGRESARRDLCNHILPRFGQLRLDQVGESDVLAWLAAKVEVEDLPPGTDSRLHSLLSRMWALAVELKLPGADSNPLEGSFRFDRRGQGEGVLTAAEAQKLLEAARTSHNRQLKYILSLLMLTGARPGELLGSQWRQIDLAAGVLRFDGPGSEKIRDLRLSPAAIALLAELPRWEGCPYLVANPITRRPYQSIARSWDVARSEAGLPYLEIDDLRYCDLGSTVWEDRLLDVVREPVADADPESAAPGRSEDRPAPTSDVPPPLTEAA